MVAYIISLLVLVTVGFLLVPAYGEEFDIIPIGDSVQLGCHKTPEGCFNDPTIKVKTGDKVIFHNPHDEFHYFNSGNLETGPQQIFNTGLIYPGDTFTWTPKNSGIVQFFCLIHPWMSGTITVTPADNGSQDNSEEKADDDNADAIIELVERLIEEAVESDASDIHIQPSEFDLDIRYRIDGVIQSIMVLPVSRTRAINSRLKVMANLDIAETRKPQDGRFKHQMPSGKVFDFRLSTYPTEHGEKTVMRILDPSKGQISLDKLGFSDSALNKWNDAIGNSTGIILVTGPTGSGKSTTLYATLGLLNTPEVNILTIEDPVEYNMKGIAQGQVNEKAGMTFSAALSSMLRQDPDIIMVGEMRDVATIELAVRAALTGHLVLSTLHTNDTTSSYSRLLDMGIDPFLITSTVRAIIAQRLIRSVCSNCKVSRKVNEYEIDKLGFKSDDIVFEANPEGCQNCGGKGYKGRTGIYELLKPTLKLNDMVNNRLSDHEIRTQAIQDGMDTLDSESRRLVIEGKTTIEEITRVL